jgi:hypothetical protein
MKDVFKFYSSPASYSPLYSREDKNPINVAPDSSNRKKKIAQHTGKEYFELKLSNKILQLPYVLKDLKAEIDTSRYIPESSQYADQRYLKTMELRV